MKIYSMTATFGKLEHEVLRLEPGLNVIHAPNEWGKSTWCAFLVAMLYGLDTRAKTTRNILADKDRYQPWSGSPMQGRIDLDWNGRAITIERRTKGRIPLGEFRAYETESGLDVPELTAANCGKMLLGESQSVFRRAGFISLSDLPVTQDDDLRRRLNALVTTGDESGDGDRLAQGLRDLRNRCRYNKSGLLPQAEEELDALTETLREMEALETSLHKLKERRGEAAAWLRELENHAQAMAYAASQTDAGRVAQARDDRDRELRRMEKLEAECAALPDYETAIRSAQQLRTLRQEQDQLNLEMKLLPPAPEQIPHAAVFDSLSGRDAVARARQDAASYQSMASGGLFPIIAAAVFCAAGAGTLLTRYRSYGILALAFGAVLLAAGLFSRGNRRRRRSALAARYGSGDTRQWLRDAEDYAAAQRDFDYFSRRYQASRSELDQRKDKLDQRRQSLCGNQSVDEMLLGWEQTAHKWEQFRDAREDADRAQKHYEALRSMARAVDRPAMEDHLNLSDEETRRQIRDAGEELQRLNNRAGQYRGRIETLGDRQAMQKQADELQQRIQKLELTVQALTIAQQTLTRASAELQRRFAPRITHRAQELIGSMTGGRYDRLTLAEDLSIRAGAQQEDTLHSVRWRSSGTADQLYLALRLAVAEELTPESPLILDDALARCDDDRMKAVLGILREMSQTRQVILFSCQQRESQLSADSRR